MAFIWVFGYKIKSIFDVNRLQREREFECSDEIQIILNMKSMTSIENVLRLLKLKRFNKQPWWRRWTNMTSGLEDRNNSFKRLQQTNISADLSVIRVKRNSKFPK